MRTIKFRVWNNVGKRMLYDGGLEVKGNKIISKIVMQFTGLRDKNGKEIYEGDIVILENASCGKDKCLVKWREEIGGLSIIHYDEESCESYFCIAYTCEVIGNIYENPELLDKSTRKENK